MITKNRKKSHGEFKKGASGGKKKPPPELTSTELTAGGKRYFMKTKKAQSWALEKKEGKKKPQKFLYQPPLATR